MLGIGLMLVCLRGGSQGTPGGSRRRLTSETIDCEQSSRQTLRNDSLRRWREYKEQDPLACSSRLFDGCQASGLNRFVVEWDHRTE